MTNTTRCQNPKCDKDITQSIQVKTVEGKILCQDCNTLTHFLESVGGTIKPKPVKRVSKTRSKAKKK